MHLGQKKTLKHCGGCDRDLPSGKFHRSSRTPDGMNTQCADCVKAHRERRQLEAGPTEYHRRWVNHLSRRYGLTEAEYCRLWSAQSGACAICGDGHATGTRFLCVDHCHETGRIRGLLCKRCNTGLGLLGDDRLGLMRAVSYLEACQ